MPRPRTKQSVPQVEPPRRGRPALKYNAELAEAYGITPGADPPRELVRVDVLPDPPAVEIIQQAQAGRHPIAQAMDIDQIVLDILKDEAGELALRLERFGVKFTPAMQQEMVDHGMALLTGLVGGGTLARR